MARFTRQRLLRLPSPLQRFDPRRFPGLIRWHDASRLQSFADADAVETWPDLSGNGYDLSQATSASQPLFKVGIQNGLPAVRFDGLDDYIYTASGTHSQPLSILWVGHRKELTKYTFDGQHSTDRVANFYDTAYRMWANVYAALETPPLQWDQYACLYDTTTSDYYRQGLLKNSGLNVGTNAMTGLTLGARFNGQDFLDCDFGEILVYSRKMVAAELSMFFDYFRGKWGVA